MIKELNDRRRSMDRKTYQIKQVWDAHREIMRLSLLGMKQTRIAEIVGCTPATVSNTLNAPIVKERLELMRAARDVDAIDVGKRIQELAPKALDIVEKVLSGEIDAPISVQLREANNILDRAGHKAASKLDVRSMHITPDDIARIKQRAFETGAASGLVVDVDPE